MKRVVIVPVLLIPMLVLTGMAGVAAAQPAPPLDTGQPPVFRTQTQLVPLSVTVTDPDQQFVRGLAAADFTILEDGVEQEVRFFEAADVPLDLIILIDTSSSMLDKMSIVHAAAVGFFRTLRQGDRGAIVTFDDRVDIVQPLTSSLQELEEGVRRTQARGSTSLYDAIYISLREFGRAAQSDHQDVRRQAIVVLTDGEDTSSLLAFDEVLSLARKSGVSIYPISVESDYGHIRIVTAAERRQSSEAKFSLRQIAQETGAQAFFTTQMSDLKSIYTTIGEELSAQYSLAYTPSDTEKDGRFRRIVVRVADRPELRLRTRTGYIAESMRASLSSPYRQNH